jgi:hypothetical protein
VLRKRIALSTLQPGIQLHQNRTVCVHACVCVNGLNGNPFTSRVLYVKEGEWITIRELLTNLRVNRLPPLPQIPLTQTVPLLNTPEKQKASVDSSETYCEHSGMLAIIFMFDIWENLVLCLQVYRVHSSPCVFSELLSNCVPIGTQV